MKPFRKRLFVVYWLLFWLIPFVGGLIGVSTSGRPDGFGLLAAGFGGWGLVMAMFQYLVVGNAHPIWAFKDDASH